MLQVNSVHKLEEMEAALSRALQRHGVQLLAVSRLRPDAMVFNISHADLTAALLEADIRFAAFLPFRIAACFHGSGVTLQAISPKQFCRLLNRPDLERLVAPLETLLRDILEEAAKPRAMAAHAPQTTHSGLGAREDQMNVRGYVPQRIDGKGSKVEDLAGTGEHDAAGG